MLLVVAFTQQFTSLLGRQLNDRFEELVMMQNQQDPQLAARAQRDCFGLSKKMFG